MKLEMFQTQDEVDVLKMECVLIKEMMDKGILKGDLAEAGVYEGATAEIIRSIMPETPLHLFDTFTGLPNTMVPGLDSESYYEGHMEVDIEKTKFHFRPYSNVHLYPGFIPDTLDAIKDKTFAFVHIDLDIYQSTRDALLFFYPRMEIGGTILIHDYPAHAGVAKAVDELMKDVGTKHSLHMWKQLGRDPMIESGNRQLIIRRRVPELKLNLEVVKPKFPQVNIPDAELREIIDGKS